MVDETNLGTKHAIATWKEVAVLELMISGDVADVVMEVIGNMKVKSNDKYIITHTKFETLTTIIPKSTS